jgi:hypothetical protein
MLTICPNNFKLVVSDDKQNLHFFDIKNKSEIKLVKTLSVKFKIGATCFNYTGSDLFITQADGIKVWKYKVNEGQEPEELPLSGHTNEFIEEIDSNNQIRAIYFL